MCMKTGCGLVGLFLVCTKAGYGLVTNTLRNVWVNLTLFFFVFVLFCFCFDRAGSADLSSQCLVLRSAVIRCQLLYDIRVPGHISSRKKSDFLSHLLQRVARPCRKYSKRPKNENEQQSDLECPSCCRNVLRKQKNKALNVRYLQIKRSTFQYRNKLVECFAR